MAKDFEIELTKGDLVCLAWLIQNRPGVDKSNARIIAKIEDGAELFLADEISSNKRIWRDTYKGVTFDSIVWDWIKDEVEKHFGTNSIPGPLASTMLALSDKLTFKEIAE
jgi:hypothetical protein